MPVRITGLHTYLIKGCRGTPVANVRVTPRGLTDDRQFIVAAPSRTRPNRPMRMLSQRTHPVLATVVPSLRGDTLELKAATSALNLPSPHDSGSESVVCVWGAEVRCQDYGDEAAAYFDKLLGLKGARLLRMAQSERRGTGEVTRTHFQVSLADGFPILLTSEASIRELNSQRGPAEPMAIARFRPNVVVDGSLPFEEDSWRVLHATESGLYLHLVSPCSRCQVPDVDQESGEGSQGEFTRFLKETRSGERSGEHLQRLFPGAESAAAGVFSEQPKSSFFGVNVVPSMSPDFDDAEAAECVAVASPELRVGGELEVIA